MDTVNIFGGTGFIGSAYHERYGGVVNARDNYVPQTDNILYFISTTDNYNVFTDLFIDIDTNLTTLMKVIDNRETVFNFISSWFVYGPHPNLPASETDPTNPAGFYSITKKAAEDMLISYCLTTGMKYRILRLSNVVGPNDGGMSSKKNAIQWMIERLKQNETVLLYEGGNVYRDILYIDDCIDAIDLVITKGDTNTIYNIGSGIPTPVGGIIHAAKTALHSTSRIKEIQTPDFHKLIQAKSIYLDTTKLRQLGFSPRYPTYFEWLPLVTHNEVNK